MEGADFKNQLEESIFFVNQDPFAVTFSDIGGKIIPSGKQYLRVTEKIDLHFTEDPDMCFICWEVWQDDVLLQPEVAEKFIHFDNRDSAETKLEVKSKAENITVRAKVAVRPKVILTNPQSEKNILRNTTIVIMCNVEVPESAIYWTKDELLVLGADLTNALSVPGKTDLYYAYKTTNKDSSLHYKNIEIRDFRIENSNFLQYYGVPEIDETNRKCIRIPVKSINKLPPALTEILVTLKKDFAYAVGSKIVNLQNDYCWTYITSNGQDETDPTFSIDPANAFTVTVADNNQKKFNKDKRQLTDYNANSTELKKNGIPNIITSYNSNSTQALQNELISMNAKNKKLWIRGCFFDMEAGPAELTYSVKIKNNNKYTASEKEIASGKISDLSIIGPCGFINRDLDEQGYDYGGRILEIPQLQNDGVYEITFKATDAANNSIEKSFAFIYDVSVQVPSSDSTGPSFTISQDQKKLCTAKDHVKGTFNETGTRSWDCIRAEICGKTVTKNQVYDLENLNSDSYIHKLTVTYYDFYGNSQSYVIDNVCSTPQKEMIYYTDGYWSYDYDSKRTPMGIILKTSNDNDRGSLKTGYVQILSVDEKNNLKWGDSIPTDNKYSSLNYGQDLTELYMTNKDAVFKTLRETENSIWNYTLNVKNLNGTNPVKWYIPAYNEFSEKVTEIVNVTNILKEKGYPDVSGKIYFTANTAQNTTNQCKMAKFGTGSASVNPSPQNITTSGANIYLRWMADVPF